VGFCQLQLATPDGILNVDNPIRASVVDGTAEASFMDWHPIFVDLARIDWMA